MATATSVPAAAVSSATGVCVPPAFPADEIRSTLEGAGHLVAFWHADRSDVVEACRAHEPALLLLGAQRPGREALDCVRAVNEAETSTQVILLCDRSGQGEIRKALDAGVRGLVSLSDVAAALPAVLDVVHAGQICVPGSHGKELRKEILTAREKQILGLVVMGMTNAEIAGKLFLAESTVKSHLSSAFTKLGVSSRSEAASVILDPQSGAGLGILTIPTK